MEKIDFEKIIEETPPLTSGALQIKYEECKNAMKEAVRQAIDITLKEASENGKCKREPSDHEYHGKTIYEHTIDKQSIISLSDRLKKELIENY